MLNTNINNSVILGGMVTKEAEYSHEVYGEKFYTIMLQVERDSGIADTLPVLVSDRVYKVKELSMGTVLYIKGEYRSFNRHLENTSKLELNVFAQEIAVEVECENTNANRIELDGYICKEPVYRETPNGREITDLFIAVNRDKYGKSDYIPCIAWGRNARFASRIDVGTHIKVYGRIQSREYQKRISDTELETRIAYEVSISKIYLAGEDTDEEKNS